MELKKAMLILSLAHKLEIRTASLFVALSVSFARRLFAWIRGMKEPQGNLWFEETFSRQTDVLTMRCLHVLVDNKSFWTSPELYL